MRVTANDYMTPDIIDGAYNEQQRLRRLFFDLIQRIVELSEPDTALGNHTIPYPTLINVVERNIDKLTAGGYRPSNMQNTVDWKGELNDLVRFSYRDVNRWFETFEQLEGLIYSIVYRGLITGNFSTGNDRTRQIIRSVDKYA